MHESNGERAIYWVEWVSEASYWRDPQHVCLCVCKGALYQQQEWDRSLGGLCAQRPAAGDTRDPVEATG